LRPDQEPPIYPTAPSPPLPGGFDLPRSLSPLTSPQLRSDHPRMRRNPTPVVQRGRLVARRPPPVRAAPSRRAVRGWRRARMPARPRGPRPRRATCPASAIPGS